MRIMNISVNTQAISVQNMYEKNINGSFHGLWSTGGIAGVGVSTLFVSLDVPMKYHLLSVSILAIAIAAYSYQYLLRNDRPPSRSKLKLGSPDPYIVYLGLMIFLAAICEGGMFDWSSRCGGWPAHGDCLRGRAPDCERRCARHYRNSE
jgi:hypothetical protein